MNNSVRELSSLVIFAVKPQPSSAAYNVMTSSTYQPSSSPVLPPANPAHHTPNPSAPISTASVSPHKTGSLRRPKRQGTDGRAVSGGAVSGGAAGENGHQKPNREQLKAGLVRFHRSDNTCPLISKHLPIIIITSLSYHSSIIISLIYHHITSLSSFP